MKIHPCAIQSASISRSYGAATSLRLCAFAVMLLGAARLAAASRHLEVDPTTSQVTFDVRVNIGVHSFVGIVDTWTLELVMPDQGDLPDRAIFLAEVGAMKTGKDGRDEKMRTWLEHTTHPTVRYEMKMIRRTERGFEAEGELTIHGRTRPLTLAIALERDSDRLTVRGEAEIDYREFDLRVIRLAGLITVKPVVRVAFVISGVLR